MPLARPFEGRFGADLGGIGGLSFPTRLSWRMEAHAPRAPAQRLAGRAPDFKPYYLNYQI